MLNPDMAKPLYEQIKEYLLSNISVGAFPPDSRLPSERALSVQFGVSRETVKKAINDLVQSGHLYVQIGKGTYVRRPKIDQSLEMLTSFSEEISRQHQKVSSRVLNAGIMPAAPEESHALRITLGVPLVYLRRVRLANERPMAVEDTRIVASMCPGLLDGRDFSKESLYRVLREDYGLHLTHAEQSIEARLATPEESMLLQIEPRAPILNMTRVTYTDDDQPVEYTLSAYCGSRYKFRAILRKV
jgi:GntR family transcriptional regulator